MDTEKRKLNYIIRTQLDKPYFSRFSKHQKKVLINISNCGTEILGVIKEKCSEKDCTHTHTKFKSCKSTGCPSCASLKSAKWLKKRENDIIPDTPYYTYTLKVPMELSILIRQNQEHTLNLISKCSSESLKKSLAPYNQKEMPGFLQVFHSYNQKLLMDFHTHSLFPCGYLKDGLWYERDDIPYEDIVEDFRDSMIKGLRKLHKKGLLKIHESYGDCTDLDDFTEMLYTINFKEWNSYHRFLETEEEVKNHLKYLSQGLFSLPVNDARILSFNEDTEMVSFTCRKKGNPNEHSVMTLPVETFVKRLASLILYEGFTRVRYYGFMANNVRRKKLSLIFEQLTYKYDTERNEEIEKMSANEFAEKETDWEKPCCPICGGQLIEVRDHEDQNRAPPSKEAA